MINKELEIKIGSLYLQKISTGEITFVGIESGYETEKDIDKEDSLELINFLIEVFNINLSEIDLGKHSMIDEGE